MVSAIIILCLSFLFFILISQKYKDFCAMCAAVTVTWVFGLASNILSEGNLIDNNILAMLMGGSAVGLIYYLDSRNWLFIRFFKFPILVLLFYLIYLILGGGIVDISIYLIIILWIMFVAVFYYRNDKTKNWFKSIIDCCKNW